MRAFRLLRTLQLLWLAFWDKRTPPAAKILVIVALLYGISPIDIIPDILPIIGILDDLGLLLMAIVFFLRSTHAVRAKLALSHPTWKP